jgi:hypothetical protein
MNCKTLNTGKSMRTRSDEDQMVPCHDHFFFQGRIGNKIMTAGECFRLRRMVAASLVVLWIGLARLGVAAAQDASAFARDKVALEQAMEQKAQDLLDNALGPGKSRIKVNLTINPTATEQLQYDSRDQKGYLWQDPKTTSHDILPGFSAYTNEGTPAWKPPQSPKSYTRSFAPFSEMIQKVEAIVFVDPSIEPNRVEEVRTGLTTLLGINPERRDVLLVQTTAMVSPFKAFLLTPDSLFRLLFWMLVFVLAFLAVASLAWAGWIVAKAVMTVGSQLSATHHEFAVLNERRKLPTPPPDPPKPVLLSENGHEEPKALPAPEDPGFTFLTTKNAMFAAEFLKDKDPRTICTVLGSVDAAVAGIILERLPEDVRASAVSQLGELLVVPPEERRGLALQLLDFVSAGLDTPSQLADIFMGASPDMQKQIVDKTKSTQPGLAQFLEASLMRFEDLAVLTDEDRVVLASNVPADTFATALRGLSGDLAKLLMEPLPEGMRAQIDQGLRLSGPMPLSKVQKARSTVLWKLLELRRQGKIASSVGSAMKEQMV